MSEGPWEAERRGRAGPTAKVVTAEPISAELKALAEAKLQKLGGDELEVSFEVDPAILGGMVVHLPDRVIDLSLAGRFRSYGRAVQELIGEHLATLEGWARSAESATPSMARQATGKE
ncbi:MAG TPA: F0F1 ATP synthase subunit delta [Firmicutes bacterium]|nr:F0F1 ATP synthase subunit delta [Bacillota bacterium]